MSNIMLPFTMTGSWLEEKQCHLITSPAIFNVMLLFGSVVKKQPTVKQPSDCRGDFRRQKTKKLICYAFLFST